MTPLKRDEGSLAPGLLLGVEGEPGTGSRAPIGVPTAPRGLAISLRLV